MTDAGTPITNESTWAVIRVRGSLYARLAELRTKWHETRPHRIPAECGLAVIIEELIRQYDDHRRRSNRRHRHDRRTATTHSTDASGRGDDSRRRATPADGIRPDAGTDGRTSAIGGDTGPATGQDGAE